MLTEQYDPMNDLNYHLERCELFLTGEPDLNQAKAHLLRALSILKSEHQRITYETSKPQR